MPSDRDGDLERFAVEQAFVAAWRTEFWLPEDPDYGFIDWFEAAATRNIGMLRGFETLAEDVIENGILPQLDSPQTRLVTDGGVDQSDGETDRGPKEFECIVCGAATYENGPCHSCGSEPFDDGGVEFESGWEECRSAADTAEHGGGA